MEIETTLEKDQVTQEDKIALVDNLLKLANDLVEKVHTSQDVTGEALQALEICKLLSNTTHKEDEPKHLPWAVISQKHADIAEPFFKARSIGEDFEVRKTFETYDEASEFALLNEDVAVVNINWQDNEYFVKMVVE